MEIGSMKAPSSGNDILGANFGASTKVAPPVGVIPVIFSSTELPDTPPTPPPSSISSPPRMSVDSIESSFVGQTSNDRESKILFLAANAEYFGPIC